MRLLNTRTFKLEEFFDETYIPDYAILSHTWEEGEVLFCMTQSSLWTTDPAVRKLKGFRKIVMACREALDDDLQYIWIDTCCIDKSSSAELSEAINSMYRWYQRAFVCYTYLGDVPAGYQVREDMINVQTLSDEQEVELLDLSLLEVAGLQEDGLCKN